MDVSAAQEWIDGCLAGHGRRRTGPLTPFRTRPWGDIHRADTDGGTVWLKVPGLANRFEVGLYDVLGRAVPDVVLVPLGLDVGRGWILLPDAGPSLSAESYADVDVDDLAAAMRLYATAQVALGDHVDEMLRLGVADMRPAAMAGLFDRAMAAARRYVATSPRPDAGERLRRAAEQGPRFAARCAELARRPGGASLDHNDLHGYNILGRRGQPATFRFYDWGDGVIAHPFACLLVPLGIAAQKGEGAVVRVRDSYLEPFAHLGPADELADTVDLACWVAKVARALVWERAIAAAGDDVDDDFASAPFEHLDALSHESFVVDP